MSREVQGMLIQIEATTAQLRRELQEADRTVNRTRQQIESQLSAVDASFDRTAQRAQQAGNLIKGAFAMAAGAGLVGSIIKQADAYGEMAERLRMATGSASEYNEVQKRLQQTAQETFRPLREAQELYIRTADVIKGLGYNTQQTLDITDSFSYLLVTNAASADTAESALSAYSKSLQTGKVSAEAWTSIMTAIPTLVDAIAESTGMAASEVRALGASGKLALDNINTGLLDTVDVNRAASAQMKTTVGDALTNISNGISTYLGELNQSTEATYKLADALSLIGNNIDSIALVASAAGFAALASASLKASAAAFKNAAGQIQQRIETQKAAQSAVASAAAQLDYAKAQLASTQATVAATTGMRRLTLVQTELAARQKAVTQATNALTAAQANLAKTTLLGSARSLLALLGGPTGLAITAATLTAGFLAMRPGAEDASSGIDHLTQSVEEYAKTWERAGQAQRRVLFNETRQGVEDAEKEIGKLARQIERELEAAHHRVGNMGPILVPVKRGIEELRQAALDGADNLDELVQELLKITPAGTKSREEVERLAAQLANQSGKMVDLSARMAEYTDRVNENTGAVRENAAAADQLGESATKYIDGLRKRMDSLWAGADPVKQALLHIKEHGRYTKEEADAILAGAQALKGKQDAQTKATRATRSGTSALQDKLAAIDGLVAKYDPLAKAQADYEKNIELADRALSKNRITLEQHSKVIQGLWKDLNQPVWDKQKAEADKATEALKRLDDQLEAVRDRFEPLRSATRRLAADKALLKEALNKNIVSLEEYEYRLRQLDDEYASAQRSATEWGKWTESALDRVDSAFADAWRNIGDGFKGFRDNLTNGFKQMLAELAHMAITRPIVMQIGAAMGIGGGGGGGAGIWGGLLGAATGSGGGSAGSEAAGGVAGSVAGGGGGGGFGWGTIASMGRGIYSAFTGGLAGMMATSGGYIASLGGMLGSEAIKGFGMGMQGAMGPMQSAAANSAYGMGSKVASMATPVGWGLAALMGSMNFYKAGYTLDHKQVANQQLSKVSFAIDPALSTVFDSMMKATQFASKNLLEPLFGEKWGNILSLGPLFSGISNTVNKKLFGGAWKTKDAGLGLGIKDGDLFAGQFEYRKKKGGLFSSSKKKTIWTALDEETDAAMREIYGDTRDSVADLFKALSFEIGEGALSGLQLATDKISTMGKTSEKIQEAIGEWFGTAAEAMTSELHSVLGTGLDYDLEQMQEFVGNLLGTNEVLRYLNVGMYSADIAGAKLAERLSELAGGLDILSENASAYYDHFFTAEEKITDTIDAITRTFAEAEVQIPATREAYRAMVEDIDVTTDAGQKMFATLMALSGQAAQFFDIAEQRAAQAVADAMGEANNAFALLQRSISAERSRLTREFNLAVQAEQEAARRASEAAQASANARIDSLSSALSASNELARVLQNLDRVMSNALDRLRSTEADAVALRRSQSVTLLQDALAQARAGKSLAGIEGLEGAIGVAATLDTATYRTFEDFQREQGRTANLIADLQKLNGKQLTAEERILESLEQQLDAAREHASSITSGINGISDKLQAEYDAAMAGLDSQLAAAQAQMDALNGVDNSILSVDESVNRMSAAVVAAINAQTELATTGQMEGKLQDNEATIKRLYESIVGYEADKEGVRFWSEHFAGGGTYFDLIDALVASAHAAALPKVPGFASGGLHAGGLRLVGENGPELEVTGPSRIYSASQTANMLAGDSQRTVAAIQKLESTVSAQTDALRSIAKHTHNTAQRVEMLERWDYDGMPESREAM